MTNETKDKSKGRNTTAVALLVVLLATAGGAYWFVLKPRMELQELAADTCDELEGAIMLQVGSILSKAQGRAERLGFEPYELGDQMREECPGLMAGLAEWTRKRQEQP